jgi:hypothetical protein
VQVVEWLRLAQDRVQWPNFIKMVKNFDPHKGRELHDRLINYQFLKERSAIVSIRYFKCTWFTFFCINMIPRMLSSLLSGLFALYNLFYFLYALSESVSHINALTSLLFAYY